MAKSTSKRTTMRDIAERAGVSVQTVSRVLNDQVGVSDVVRMRIKGLIEEMHYLPNQAAQVLKNQRTRLIETIFVDIGYMGEIGLTIAQIAATANDADYHVLFSIISADELKSTLEQSAARMVEGFILLAPRLQISDQDMLNISQEIPFVRMGNPMGTMLPSVTYDFQQGTHMAIDYLVELGHRRIAEISGPLDQLNAVVRHRVFEAAIRGHGLEPGPSVDVPYGMADGYRAAHILLERGEPFTAIFAGNDDLALGAIRALTEAGKRIPEDLSIIGFDDAQHAQFLNPPLSTIRLDLAALGKIAAKYLVELIEEDDATAYQRILVPELVPRASTGPVPN